MNRSRVAALLAGWIAMSSSALAQTDAPLSQEPAPPPPAVAAPAPLAPVAAPTSNAPTSNVLTPAAPAPALPAPPPVPAPAPLAPDAELDADAERLEAVFVELAESNSISIGSALLRMVFGGAAVGVGLYIAIDGAEMGRGAGRVLVGGASLTVGSIMLANAIHGFSRTTTDEDRLVRFRNARKTLDRVELARFEGELQAETQIARSQRIVAGVESIGMITGGAGVIVVAAAVDDFDKEGRTLGLVLGSVYMLMGTVQAIASLGGESQYEGLLRGYQRKSSPGLALHVAPSVGTSAFGLHLSGSF